MDILTPMNSEDEAKRHDFSGKSAQNFLIPFSKYTIKDWLRMFRYGKRNRFYNHMPASDVKKYVSKEIWDEYYKFCFERNPIEKAISHYKWRGSKVNYHSFAEYLNSADVSLIQGKHFYLDRNGKMLLDKIYKMENMEKAFVDIAEKIGIPLNELEAPTFHTKTSETDKELSAENITAQFGKQIRELFKTEYNLLYPEK